MSTFLLPLIVLLGVFGVFLAIGAIAFVAGVLTAGLSATTMAFATLAAGILPPNERPRK